MSEEEYELVLEFDTQDPEFSRGFEAGMLWHLLMTARDIGLILVGTCNFEMVLRMVESEACRFELAPVEEDVATGIPDHMTAVNLVRKEET